MPSEGYHEAYADSGPNTAPEADLAVAEACPTLPQPIKAAIPAMVKSTQGGEELP
jgi:hypothetical protein